MSDLTDDAWAEGLSAPMAVSEPLVHATKAAVKYVETGANYSAEPGDGSLVCGAPPVGFAGFICVSDLRDEIDEDMKAANPTPTCPKCRIAWDTAVEKAGGAR